MNHLLIFGLGYSAGRLAARLCADDYAQDWNVTATSRDRRGDRLHFGDSAAVDAAIATSTHILSSVPPDKNGADPVLLHYGAALEQCGARWLGYLSSVGVYGDCGGCWVDEAAALRGRRPARIAADCAWQALRDDVRIFRLPGIYGPGRSALDRVRSGRAHRIADLPDHIFNRIHVDDIVGGVLASFSDVPGGVHRGGQGGVYNLADDMPSSQNRVVEHACRLLTLPYPPLQPLAKAGLSPAACAFYAENRRVANGKAKRLLGWRPRFPSYREGLAQCLAEV